MDDSVFQRITADTRSIFIILVDMLTGTSPILHYDIPPSYLLERQLGGGGVWHDVKLDWPLWTCGTKMCASILWRPTQSDQRLRGPLKKNGLNSYATCNHWVHSEDGLNHRGQYNFTLCHTPPPLNC